MCELEKKIIIVDQKLEALNDKLNLLCDHFGISLEGLSSKIPKGLPPITKKKKNNGSPQKEEKEQKIVTIKARIKQRDDGSLIFTTKALLLINDREQEEWVSLSCIHPDCKWGYVPGEQKFQIYAWYLVKNKKFPLKSELISAKS